MNNQKAIVTSDHVCLFLDTLYPQNFRNSNHNSEIFLRKSQLKSSLSSNLTKAKQLTNKLETIEIFAQADPKLSVEAKEAIKRGIPKEIASFLLPVEGVSWHLVINGSGQGSSADSISKAWVIQFESDDDRDINDKLYDWEKLGMPQPTMQTHTGSKSVHSYWVLDKQYSAEEVFEIQVQLLRQGKFLGSDGWNMLDTHIKAFKAKTMRVPGFNHPKTGKQGWIVNCPGTLYTPEQLWEPLTNDLRGQWNKDLDLFETYKTPEERKIEAEKREAELERVKAERAKNIEEHKKRQKQNPSVSFGFGSGVPGNAVVDLIELASSTVRDLFHSGSQKNFKFTDCGVVGNELIGLQAWADEYGVTYYKSAVDLFTDWCQRSGLPNYEIISRYNSLNKTSKRPSREEELTAKLLGKSYKVTASINKNESERIKKENEARIIKIKEVQNKSKSEPEEENNSNNDTTINENKEIGWDVFELIQEHLDNLKCKDPERRKYLVENWTKEPNIKIRSSKGLIGIGSLQKIKENIVSGCLEITSDEERASEDGISLLVTNNQTIDKKLTKRINEKLNEFEFIITDPRKTLQVFQWLCSTGLGHKTVVSEHGIKWGAGYYYALGQERIVPDILLDQRYLDFEVPKNSRIIAIKSEMGTGKTQWMARLLEAIKGCGIRCLALYARVLLCSTVSDRLTLQLYNDKLVTSQEKEFNLVIDGGVSCINSLKKKGYLNFDADDWGGDSRVDILFLDEIESTLESLANGGTIKNNRSEIEANFIKLIRNILKPGGKGIVILSDANLKESTIQLIQEIADWDEKDGDINDFTCRVINKWKYEEDRVAYIYSDPQTFVGAMAKAATTEKRMYIATDTRESKSENGFLTSEAIATAIGELGKDTIRIDQETQHALDHPDYGVAHSADALVRELKRRDAHLIASPTLNCGISFDKKPNNPETSSDFTSVWGANKGVVSLNDAQQMIERERSNVDRHLYITKTAKPNGVSYLTTESALAQEESLKNILTLEGIRGALGLMYNPQQVDAILKGNIGHENPWLAVWRRKTLLLNAWAGIQYAMNFKAHLQERGYKVVDVKPQEIIKSKIEIPKLEDKTENKKVLQETLTQLKTSIEEVNKIVDTQTEKAFAKYSSEVLQMFQAIALKCYLDKAEAIVNSDEKIVTEELLKKTDRKMLEHHAVVKHYYNIWARGVACTIDTLDIYFNHKFKVETGFLVWCRLQGFEAAQAKSFKEDARHISTGSKSIRDCKSNTAIQNILDKIGMPEFIRWAQEKSEYSIKDREVAEFNQKLVESRYEIKVLLGASISIAPDKATTNIGNILRLACWNHKKTKQASIDGERIRFYELVPPPAIFIEFWMEWASKGGIIMIESETEKEIYSHQLTVMKRTISKVDGTEDLFADVIRKLENTVVAI